MAALKGIYAAKAPFVSRGDNSGTGALEKRLWKTAGLNPTEAGGGWYREIGGGMGAALNIAAAMNAYTLSDRGTWLSFGHRDGMKIEVEGDPRLLNRYDVIVLNPKLHAETKQGPASQLAAWLASSEGHEAISSYTIAGQRLFNSENDPKR